MRRADTCDACGVALREEWAAVGASGPLEQLAIACFTCAPIVERIDRLVEYGHLEADAAAAMFEELRWGHAREPRRGPGGDRPRVSDVLPVLDVLPSTAAPAAGL